MICIYLYLYLFHLLPSLKKGRWSNVISSFSSSFSSSRGSDMLVEHLCVWHVQWMKPTRVPGICLCESMPQLLSNPVHHRRMWKCAEAHREAVRPCKATWSCHIEVQTAEQALLDLRQAHLDLRTGQLCEVAGHFMSRITAQVRANHGVTFGQFTAGKNKMRHLQTCSGLVSERLQHSVVDCACRKQLLIQEAFYFPQLVPHMTH